MWRNPTQSTYIIEADLNKTTLRSLSGAVTPEGKVSQYKLEEFWANNNAANKLQILINGTFFQEYNQPTGIAFGLKQDDRQISYGYGLDEFPAQTMTVSWSAEGISIEPYDRRTFEGNRPNAIGALDPAAGKSAAKSLRRTFIGVKNPRVGANTYTTVLLFVSESASQAEAASTLGQFGADRVAMLDGGSSTGLIVNGTTLLQPKTRLPQTIGIFSR